jgi:serine protease Do
MNIVPSATAFKLNRRPFPGWILLLAILLAGESPLPAQVQPASDSPTRSRLFAELALDARKLERQNILKRLVELVTPSVVHISAYKSIEPGSAEVTEEAGSGVIVMIKNTAMVITNRHVVKDASLRNIDIKLHDGRPAYVEKIWSDKATDIAVLALRDTPSSPRLVPARLGNSDKAEIGDFVVAVGSPFGLSHSVTYGIISAKGRRDLKLGNDDVTLQDFLQTDAAINPGNSGGPLLNLRAELIGINTAMASSTGRNEGIGFSIPINMAMVVARQLVEHGHIRRAYLGVRMDHRFRNETAHRLGLSHAQGVRVTGITANSPADEAELHVNDVILSFGTIRIEDDNHLSNLVSFSEAGSRVELTVFRDGTAIKIKLVLGERRKFEPAQ